jgi:hypothetical protein
MPAKRTGAAQGQRNVFVATLARLRHAGRYGRRRRRGGAMKLSLLARFAAGEYMDTPDPVSLAIFAIDQVGPAAVRACASGIEVRIAAADEATAAVIRAALVETSRRRPTDRLIRVVID